MPEIIETKPACKQTGRYIGWPTVVCAPDGVLHAVFSGDRDGHICPFGKTFTVSSEDQGETWSEPRLVNNTPLDDRDTGLCVFPDGTLVVSWFTSHYYRAYEINWTGYRDSGKYPDLQPWEKWEALIKAATPQDLDAWSPFIQHPKADIAEKWAGAWKEMGGCSSVEYDERFPPCTRRFGYWTRRSTDGGRTWDAPTLSPVVAPHGPNVLPDGGLIYIGEEHSWNGRLGVALSQDKGLTWRMLTWFDSDVSQDGVSARLCEPHVVATASGKLVGLARYQAAIDGDKRFVWQFDSEDGGLTWSKPRPTTLNGYPPHLLRISDGRLLASFGVRHDPIGFRFCFSEDDGKTWDVDNQLHVSAGNKDLGYPATAEVAPGSFVSVYYQKDSAGEKPCLMTTRWRG